jgi:hypothetical protein
MVLAGIEEDFRFFCGWIDSCGEVVAFFVAATAGEGKVLEVVCAAEGFGEGVLDRKW